MTACAPQTPSAGDASSHEAVPDWITPQWPVPAQVGALCTTRQGGASVAPWQGFNLGDHVGDDPQVVMRHRAQLQHRLGSRPVFMRPVHGHAVVQLQPDTRDGVEADACIALRPGLACTVIVADCLPILLSDRRGSFVAALHAGWRGLCGAGRPEGVGVVESAQRALQAARIQLDEAVAWLGPCIGPTAFEVGNDVRLAFACTQAGSDAFFTPMAHKDQKWLADLPGLARARLQAAGIGTVVGNDGSAPWCTVLQPSRFFSHRRDGVSGRMAACVWLRG